MRSVQQILSSKQLTLILVFGLSLISLLGLGYQFLLIPAQAQSIQSNVVYFVTSDLDLIEPELRPDSLSNHSSLVTLKDITFEASNEWQTVEFALNEGKVDALVIHHSSVDLIKWDVVQKYFEQQELVVMGLGVPGDELAELLGKPQLFTSTWSADSGYITPYFFYIYSYQIDGTEQDVALIQSSNQEFAGEEIKSEVQNQLSVSKRTSTDSLVDPANFTVMFSLLESHIND